MSSRDGLSRDERMRRITSVNPFAVIDNSKDSLLNQTLEVARFIRYYDPQNVHAGYFDELLNEIKMLAESDSKPYFDGSMEPSQALLYTFLEQLHGTTELFNERWSNLARWYLNDFLGVLPLSTTPDNVWLSFLKDSSTSVILKKGTGFSFKSNDKNLFTYRLTEDLEVHDIELVNAYSLFFERNKNILPAAHLGFITSLKIKDLLNDKSSREMMFGDDKNPVYAKALGLIISSPSLLLREGKRYVTITFSPEDEKWLEQQGKILKNLQPNLGDWTEEKILFELFNNVFYVTISTADRWLEIANYTVKKDGKNIVFKFILSEDFPATKGCEQDIHHFQSKYPALRIYPNFDAWLYPYSWLENFLLDKIIIETSVEGASNVLVYNELGRVDNSKPFIPFGVNTERGAWFVIGNYEMSLKDVQAVDLHINWLQLPEDERGLYGYYRAYDDEIDNRSFRLKADYLADYKWYEIPATRPFYLFSSVKRDVVGDPLPDVKLSLENVLSGIDVQRMPMSVYEEETYDYDIKSRSGFIRFVMDEPSIGFGEKRYRHLFTEQMIKNALRKKKEKTINPPLNPLIEKIKLDYRSRDVIDLKKHNATNNTDVFQLYPLGYISALSDGKYRSVPFVYNLDTDASVLLSFRNVKGGEVLTVFFDFLPVSKECTRENIPQIVWYWGNGYNWYEVSPNTILSDQTQNMFTTGHIKIRMPVDVDDFLLDSNDLLWLRAGVRKYEENIPELRTIHINVVKLELDTSLEDKSEVNDYENEGYELVPEAKLPGIKSFQQISPFYSGRDKENETDMQIRISEYVTHRGKAVTARDYERIVLQAFPDIVKVKCLPNFDCKHNRKGVVTLVVIPKLEKSDNRIYKPLTSSYFMLEIEEYILNHVSSYVKDIDVVNPVYEELMVRCDISFYEDYSLAICQTRLNEILNLMIAPWQVNKELPVFGYSINMKKMYDDIKAQGFVKDINRLSILRIVNENDSYSLYEYGKGNDMVVPQFPHVIFIPAENHIIGSGMLPEFGINDMSIDKTFIIGV
ncbi:baseplate J/gp47 family protein [Dysgonomonas sp. ZJ709]|uniref:baseplate J/gp47 family protein n=1 Tax=Dysgonomonas sp. ZJ709 TaxID=2709797 RepID=UPI0013ED9C5F|nr:baseplate J/gp47 family protein [Dysgonomonas sp. ZJ709]